MTFAIFKDDNRWREYASKEQCAAEILVKGWCVIEQYGTVFVKGIEIRECVAQSPDNATVAAQLERIR